jgi:hypothetical protein
MCVMISCYYHGTMKWSNLCCSLYSAYGCSTKYTMTKSFLISPSSLLLWHCHFLPTIRAAVFDICYQVTIVCSKCIMAPTFFIDRAHTCRLFCIITEDHQQTHLRGCLVLWLKYEFITPGCEVGSSFSIESRLQAGQPGFNSWQGQ